MSWIIEKTIDLKKPPVMGREPPPLLMLPGDENAHQWRITVLLGGVPANLEGFTASGEFLRHDNTLVTCSGANAAIDGNVVTVTFRAECYNVPGGMRGAVRLSGQSGTVTLADQAFIIQRPIDGETVEDEYIPSLPDLLGQVARLEQANNTAMVLAAISGIVNVYVEDHTLYIKRTPMGAENAYEAAVDCGYEGTETEWNAFVAAVTNNTSIITQANTAAQAALTAAEGKAEVESETVTATAAGWTGEESPYTQTILCTIATATNNLIVGVGGALTSVQKAAIDLANIVCTGQGDGTITLSCYAIKPEVDIPINVLGVN